jgi:hypothetical protein
MRPQVVFINCSILDESDSMPGDRKPPDPKVLTLSGEKVRRGVFGPVLSSWSDADEPWTTDGKPMEATWSSILAFSAALVVIEPIRFRAFATNDPGEDSSPPSSRGPEVVRARLLRLSMVVSSSVVEKDPE